MFKEITSSATRVVLVAIIITLCIITAYVVALNAQKEIVLTTILGIFSNVTIAIVAFYFGQKSKPTDQAVPVNPGTQESTLQV